MSVVWLIPCLKAPNRGCQWYNFQSKATGMRTQGAWSSDVQGQEERGEITLLSPFLVLSGPPASQVMPAHTEADCPPLHPQTGMPSPLGTSADTPRTCVLPVLRVFLNPVRSTPKINHQNGPWWTFVERVSKWMNQIHSRGSSCYTSTCQKPCGTPPTF